MSKLEECELRNIAVTAEAHPKTVRRRIEGRTVRGISAQRVDRALRVHGWVPLGDGSEGWARADTVGESGEATGGAGSSAA